MLTSTFCRLLPPVSLAVPQIELEQPALQVDALYGPASGKEIVDVGATVSTITATDATPVDVHVRKLAVTR
jgi:hypothetical protein